jgi:hypothetical protein
MRNQIKTAIIKVALVGMFSAQASAQSPLPWRLADYPTGGQALSGMISGSLVDEGSLIAPTCTALRPGNTQQIASGVSGIGSAISNSSPDNAASIVDGLPACCEVLTAVSVDARIALGAAIAQEARALAESDIRSAQEVELVVAICEDDILARSYQLARGQDNLGQLIAQEETDPDGDPPSIPPDTTGGGGVPSVN